MIISEHIVYDFEDKEMMNLVRPSLDDAFAIREQIVALDFIGRRASAPGNRNMIGSTSDERIALARSIIREAFLPHVGTDDSSNTKKGYFLGYMVNKLLLTALGRRNLDDRDHLGNKRLDLAGPLMSFLFRSLFRNLIREVGQNLPLWLPLRLCRLPFSSERWPRSTLIEVATLRSTLASRPLSLAEDWRTHYRLGIGLSRERPLRLGQESVR